VELLVEAIARDYPTKTPRMRELEAVSQRATLAVFGNVSYSSPAARNLELWRVARGGRELRCLAVYMPTSIDLGQ
jgi:hypothetical protein